MERKGVVEKVPVCEAYDWCHPMVVVPKKDSPAPRITVDLTALNKFVKRPAYPTRPPRDAVASIPRGMKFFTKLDSRHGYWQVPLDSASSVLTTFLTPWGPYRFKRNVMGLVSAGDEHNRRTDEAFTGLSNIVKVVEDVLIFDEDYDTHFKRVNDVIQRCHDHRITIHPRKFIFAQPSVSYCGFKVSCDGYTVDEHLVHALRKFPVPTSRTDVRSFCGLVQQFEAFCPQLTEWLLPIRSLLSPKVDFVWTSSQSAAFGKVIQELSSPRVLASFDPQSPLRLETDAAQSRGLGMALWQRQDDGSWRLLQCGSRQVTPAESRYSATEIELLAVVWAVGKAKNFLAGTSFELIVDHRPLVPILNSKSLDQLSSPRLVRLKEKLALYRFTAVWRPGVQHKVVDCLSRYPVDKPNEEDELTQSDLAECVAASLLAANLDAESGEIIIEDVNIVRLKTAGQEDDTYRMLLEQVSKGFPAHRKDVPSVLLPYFPIKDDLCIDDGVVLFGQRIIVPQRLRKEVLKALHVSHQGQDRTLRRARQVVYWPGITNDIRNVVEQCEPCAERRPSQPRQPLSQEVSPSRPFESIAADLFFLEGKNFLVVADKLSGWPVVVPFRQHATSAHVIRAIKDIMMEKGIASRLSSDGGPQFASKEFAKFCREWGIHHVFSSPHHPQANGAAEAAVKAMKHLIAKSTKKGNLDTDSFRHAMIEFRNTPRANGLSPAQIVFGRPMRSNVITHRRAFHVLWQKDATRADRRATVLRRKAKERYDEHTRSLPQLPVGTIVRIQDPDKKRWSQIGELIESRNNAGSFLVRSESGRVFWRNRRFFKRYIPQS